MNCARILWSVPVLSRGLTSRVKRKNHYESLEVDSKATQGEIKSAYFKLTMQYHPDKNNSEAAKVKFRDISEAYEVLGSYQKRKQYDRGMQIKVDYDMKKSEPYKSEDIPKEAARVRSEIYRHSSETAGGAKMYDFNRWTKAHYENTFQMSWQTKERMRMFREEKKKVQAAEINSATERVIVTLLIFVCAGGLGLLTINTNYDNPTIEDWRGNGKKPGDTDD